MELSKRASRSGKLFALVCLGLVNPVALALDASDFSDLVGFTVIASSRLKGDYYDARPGNPIVLENGMKFSFAVPFSSYSYRPPAVVFARLPASSAEASGAASIYKVLVLDRLYGARRIE